MYVWTKKAEDMARELNLEERKEGTQATCGGTDIKEFGGIRLAWLTSGYIKEI